MAALFDTVLGTCSVRWNERGITGVALPPAALRGDVPLEPPPWIVDAMARMAAVLDGAPDDLRDIAVDLDDVPELARLVYDATRAIPPGHTATYGEIAARVGHPDAARAVGQALGANPVPIVVPCHRVVGAGGKLVGFSAPGGTSTKARMLALETGARSLFD